MKAKALKTIMVAGKVYLEGQEISDLPEEQYWRLYENNAVEAIKKTKRKRRTKAEMEGVRENPGLRKDQGQEQDPVEGTVPMPLEETSALDLTNLPM